MEELYLMTYREINIVIILNGEIPKFGNADVKTWSNGNEIIAINAINFIESNLLRLILKKFQVCKMEDRNFDLFFQVLDSNNLQPPLYQYQIHNLFQG